MASHLQTAIALSAFAALLAAAPAGGYALELAQNAPVTATPNVVAPLPDLWATAHMVKLTCLKGQPITATFSVTVKNQAKADANLTRQPLYHIVTARMGKVSPQQLFYDNPNQVVASPATGPVILKGGSEVKTTVTLTKIPRTNSMVYRFEIVADPDNVLAESKENNNVAYRDVQNTCY
jgi:hypothetical protein